MSYQSSSSASMSHLFRLSLALLLVVGFPLVGCDSGGGGGDNSTTISGRATNNTSSGSSAAHGVSSKSSQDGVEGATVTAVRVGANGSTTTLAGTATTNANGEFTITLEEENVSNVVMLKAEGEGGYSSNVIVQVDGQSQVDAQPMTAETAAEAEVYVEAKSEDEASSHDDGVTVADVAVYVNAQAAADINAGQTQAAEVGAAIASSVEAEAQSNSDTDGGASEGAVAEAKANLYADLQSSLATASSAEARAQAVTMFENGMANLYAEADGSAESQARSRQTGTSVMIEFSAEASSDANVGLRKQAELLRAEATARAQEAIFEAEGASDATLDALVSARQQLKTDLRAATSVDAMINAHSTYQATVKTQMENTFGLSSNAIATAESKISTNIDALFSALADIGGLLDDAVQAALDAYSSFYTSAQASAKASFQSSLDSDETAEAAAKILVFASAQSQAS